MKYLISLFSCILFYNTSIGQNNDRQAVVYNIATSSVIGGIGALINKKPKEKPLKVFFKGFYQGALGGYMVFESKRMISNLSSTENYGYAWPSKILNSAGNSIVRNAASNRNFWERWHMNIGFNHLEYDIKRDKKFRYRVLPMALVGTIDGFIYGSMDIKRSIKLGQFIFKSKQNNPDYIGQTFVNSIKFVPNDIYTIPSVLTHEIIHIYQYEGTFGFNSFLDKPLLRFDEKSKWFNTYNSIFLSDFNYIIDAGFNGFQDLIGTPSNEQIQEKEALYYQFRTRQ